MRPEKNPLDLNNFPDDFSRDGKMVLEEGSSSSGYRRKKNGGKDGKEDRGKVYECRFCSLKFCKSQALGGHMNRHRQERETETLNRARQLVFSKETQGVNHLGYHPTGNIGDPTLYNSMYGPRTFTGPSSAIPPPQQPPPLLPQPPQPTLYPSPSRLTSYGSQYPHHHHHHHHDYYVGHALNSSTNCQPYPPPHNATTTGQALNYRGAPGGDSSNNYTCIGAPVGHGGPTIGLGSGGSLRNMQEDGLNSWGRSFTAGQRLNPPAPVDRFQPDSF